MKNLRKSQHINEIYQGLNDVCFQYLKTALRYRVIIGIYRKQYMYIHLTLLGKIKIK